jgi:homopolymeric O-antigen transport system ATP-binding protein
MPQLALRMEQVYKKFRRGELYDSLRDLIPALTGRMFRQRDLSPSDDREFWALQDVSFEVHRGEAFGIIGHNGAGKSTLLKILSRVMQPTRGEMVVNGRLSALIEVSAGFHPDLTGRENIYLNGTILGMKRREIDAKLDAIIAFSGLEEFIDTPVKRYSSGMHARLGFSVAAHVDPDLLLVDEVLSVGDYVFQQRCLSRMAEVIRGGTTVLFVSHNLRAVSDLCPRSLLLDHGRCAAIGDTSEVIGHYMDRVRSSGAARSGGGVTIASVTIRDGQGRAFRFESGGKARVEVEVIARRSQEKVAIVIFLKDENYYTVFNTSTERLGHEPYDFQAGDTLRCAFELELVVGYGTYHLCASLYRYDASELLDTLDPAVSFHVGSPVGGGRGVAPCNARVVSVERTRAEPAVQARELHGRP